MTPKVRKRMRFTKNELDTMRERAGADGLSLSAWVAGRIGMYADGKLNPPLKDAASVIETAVEHEVMVKAEARAVAAGTTLRDAVRLSLGDDGGGR